MSAEESSSSQSRYKQNFTACLYKFLLGRIWDFLIGLKWQKFSPANTFSSNNSICQLSPLSTVASFSSSPWYECNTRYFPQSLLIKLSTYVDAWLPSKLCSDSLCSIDTSDIYQNMS